MGISTYLTQETPPPARRAEHRRASVPSHPLNYPAVHLKVKRSHLKLVDSVEQKGVKAVLTAGGGKYLFIKRLPEAVEANFSTIRAEPGYVSLLNRVISGIHTVLRRYSNNEDTIGYDDILYEKRSREAQSRSSGLGFIASAGSLFTVKGKIKGKI
ncbi:hypothetical protein FQN57_002734 [Myotisia sp. PD_48]|nr:hypothetical protein FQN57_002734 [Myotisia sp. PD_48]